MKKLLLPVAALLLTTGLFAQKKSDDVAKFKTESIDLGKLKQDVPATAIFEVTNISKEPLIIEQANPTCGCTISDYTKEPIAPGKTGYIKATYNAKNLNMFEKHLTVKFAGVEDMKSITIKGEVIKADDAATAAPASTLTATPEAKSEVMSTPTKVQATSKTATPAPASTKKTQSTKKITAAPAKN